MAQGNAPSVLHPKQESQPPTYGTLQIRGACIVPLKNHRKKNNDYYVNFRCLKLLLGKKNDVQTRSRRKRKTRSINNNMVCPTLLLLHSTARSIGTITLFLEPTPSWTHGARFAINCSFSSCPWPRATAAAAGSRLCLCACVLGTRMDAVSPPAHMHCARRWHAHTCQANPPWAH